jgi:hypothetical protein
MAHRQAGPASRVCPPPPARAWTEAEAGFRRRSPEIGGTSRGAEPTVVLRGERGFVRCAERPPGSRESPAASLPERLRRREFGRFVYGSPRAKLMTGMDRRNGGEAPGAEGGEGEALERWETSR